MYMVMTPATIAGALRLARSMGLVIPARPQATMAAPAIGTFVGNRQAAGTAPSFNSDLSWNALGVGMGLDNEIKINEAALGKFMPSKSKKVESYGNGFLYTPKDWGLA